MKFERKSIEDTALWKWSGDDFYVLSYPPTRRRTHITDFVLAFKNNNNEAIAVATQLVSAAIQRIEPVLKRMDCRYVVCIPPSTAFKTNSPCETVSRAIATQFKWIEHLPGALRRTKSVPKSALAAPGERPTYDDHRKTIAYVGKPNNTEHSIIMLDDVITRGTVSEACRDILIEEANFKRVIGVFLARTE